MEKKYVSTGILCGRLDSSERYYILYRNSLYGMPLTCYSLWNGFVCSNSFEMLLDRLGSKDINTNDLRDSFEDLKRLNLIVQLKDAIHYLPMRQGIGLGFDVESDSYMVQCPKVKIAIPFLCYFIWCYADGKTSLMDIRQNLLSQGIDISDNVFINAFYHLLMTEALALV